MTAIETANRLYTRYGGQASLAMDAIIELATEDMLSGSSINITHLHEVQHELTGILTSEAKLIATAPKPQQLAYRMVILQAVLEETGLQAEEITGKTRKRTAVDARHMYMYLCKAKLPNVTLGEIAGMVNRDHSTVIHGCNKIADLLPREKAMEVTIERLMHTV